MKILIRILLVLFPFTGFSQDIKKVNGVTDTNIKKVSGVSDTNIKKVNGTTLASFTGLLDDYPGAGVALSVRKLDKDYAGSCLRVQRISDNTQQSIGFEADGDIDVTSMESFCSGTDCYVVKWYDQSGNGYEFDVASGNWQIVDNGSTLLENGKPSLVSTSATPLTDVVNYSDLIGSSVIYTIAVAAKSSGSNLVLFQNDSGFDFFLSYDDGLFNASSFEIGFTAFLFKTSIIADENQHIFEVNVTSASSGEARTDGTVLTEVGSSLSSFSPSGSDTFYIGSDGSSTAKSIQEIVIYPSNQDSNRSAIYTNVSTYF